MQEVSGFVSFPANAALVERTPVTLNSSGKWIAAGQAATSRPIGVLIRASAAANDVVTARTRGKFEAVAAAVTMAIGDVVYTAASGVLTNVATSATAIGICTKGCASGGNFEWIPFL